MSALLVATAFLAVDLPRCRPGPRQAVPRDDARPHPRQPRLGTRFALERQHPIRWRRAVPTARRVTAFNFSQLPGACTTRNTAAVAYAVWLRDCGNPCRARHLVTMFRATTQLRRQRQPFLQLQCTELCCGPQWNGMMAVPGPMCYLPERAAVLHRRHREPGLMVNVCADSDSCCATASAMLCCGEDQPCCGGGPGNGPTGCCPKGTQCCDSPYPAESTCREMGCEETAPIPITYSG